MLIIREDTYLGIISILLYPVAYHTWSGKWTINQSSNTKIWLTGIFKVDLILVITLLQENYSFYCLIWGKIEKKSNVYNWCPQTKIGNPTLKCIYGFQYLVVVYIAQEWYTYQCKEYIVFLSIMCIQCPYF